MATRTLTQAAQAAKQIRSILKKEFPGQKFSVTSENYSMGDSVRIHWTDGPTDKEVSAHANKFQYGSFNGMEDIYEFDNVDSSIPQTKYVQTSREFSDGQKLKTQRKLGITNPEDYNDNLGEWNYILIRREAWTQSFYVAP